MARRVIIGTFNCKSLSDKNPIKTKNIAKTVIDSGADLAALQEISSIKGFSSLIVDLGEEWDGVYTDTVNVGGAGERMGFVYKKNRIEAVGATTLSQSEKMLYVGASKMLARAPGFARFVVDKITDVVLLTVHVFQKKPLHECRMLRKMIRSIRSTNTCNNVIVLGDFNIDCEDRFAFEKLTRDGYVPALRASKFTNLNNDSQYSNIWIHLRSCAIRREGSVCRDSIPVNVSANDYSDHCMVVAEIDLISKMSPRANTLETPSLSDGMRKIVPKFKIGNMLCCVKSNRVAVVGFA